MINTIEENSSFYEKSVERKREEGRTKIAGDPKRGQSDEERVDRRREKMA